MYNFFVVLQYGVGFECFRLLWHMGIRKSIHIELIVGNACIVHVQCMHSVQVPLDGNIVARVLEFLSLYSLSLDYIAR